MPETDRDQIRQELRLRRQIGAIGRRRKLPRLKHPNRIAEEYAKDLSIIEEILRESYAPLLNDLPRLLDSAAAERFDAGEGSRIRELITAAAASLRERLARISFTRAAETTSNQVDGFHRAQWRKQVQAGLGADVFQTDRTVPAIVDGFIASQKAFAENIGPEAAAKLEQRIGRAVAAGERWESAAGEVQDILNSTGKRARLVARDQVGKLYGQINAARQQSLGVTHFVWRTANDERVRATHVALDGQVFRYDSPPAGEGLPGQPVLCRCYAEPVFDTLLE